MREEILGIDTAMHTLAATLTYANTEQPKALIVMFAGSGPIDRDENLPSFSMNIFNTLAESFADAGYASVRYDKRGCGASGGDYISSGHSDFVADAVLVTKHVQQLPAFANTPENTPANTPLILLGHSEGAAIAPQVAAAITEPVAGFEPIKGLILLCPFSRPMREVLLQQAKNRTAEIQAMTGINGVLSRSFVRLRGGFEGMQRKFLKRMENSRADTVTHAKVTLNAKWYREMLALDIQGILKNIRTPTFAIGGGKDAQCDSLDTAALHQLITKATVTTYIEDNLTHILRCDEQPQGTRRYPELVKEPIDGLVARRCCEWLDNELEKSKP